MPMLVASSPPDRHRRPHPERAGLVRRGKHHAAAAGSAHDDRLAGELRPVPDLHAGVEGIHVDVQDVASRVIGDGRPPGLAFGGSRRRS